MVHWSEVKDEDVLFRCNRCGGTVDAWWRGTGDISQCLVCRKGVYKEAEDVRIAINMHPYR